MTLLVSSSMGVFINAVGALRVICLHSVLTETIWSSYDLRRHSVCRWHGDPAHFYPKNHRSQSLGALRQHLRRHPVTVTLSIFTRALMSLVI